MIRTRVALLLVGASAAAGLLAGAAGNLRANDGPTTTPGTIPPQCLEFMKSLGWNGGGRYPSGMGPGMMGGSPSSMFDWMRDHGMWSTSEESR